MSNLNIIKLVLAAMLMTLMACDNSSKTSEASGQADGTGGGSYSLYKYNSSSSIDLNKTVSKLEQITDCTVSIQTFSKNGENPSVSKSMFGSVETNLGVTVDQEQLSKKEELLVKLAIDSLLEQTKLLNEMKNKRVENIVILNPYKPHKHSSLGIKTVDNVITLYIDILAPEASYSMMSVYPAEFEPQLNKIAK